MKKWNYSLTTSVMWTSFDFGTVEAETKEEARTKALAKLTYDLQKVNDALNHCDNTNGMTIEMNFDCLEINELKE